MNQIFASERVRLVEDLPELGLRHGDEGVVRSSWYFPVRAYEVEFGAGRGHTNRVLLLDEHVRHDASRS